MTLGAEVPHVCLKLVADRDDALREIEKKRGILSVLTGRLFTTEKAVKQRENGIGEVIDAVRVGVTAHKGIGTGKGGIHTGQTGGEQGQKETDTAKRLVRS